GDVVPPDHLAAVLDRVGPGRAEPLVTSSLGLDHPGLAAEAPSAVGVLLVPLGSGDFVAWCRPAVAQTVEWLGDQSTSNRVTPLSPRSSFRRWRQTVTDRAVDWEQGDVDAAVALADDIGRHLDEERARRTAVRTALTARITAELAETLDPDEALRRLSHLVVPDLADWCMVTMVEEGETPGSRSPVRTAAWSHREARCVGLVSEVVAGEDLPWPLRAVHRAVTPDVEAEFAVDAGLVRVWAAELLEGSARRALLELEPHSCTVLPLVARGRVIGAIGLISAADRGALRPPERETAREIAGRAALALDNALLYRRQRKMAEVLQRSLLTDPPRTGDLQTAVRYNPAAEAAKVGGDWYDVFVRGDAATVLVIGDVVGHDIRAAAAMGQVRSLVRGIGVATDAGPAELLGHVDRAIGTLGANTIATAVVAQVHQDAEDVAAGRARVCWSNAGHPPPLVLMPDGQVQSITHGRPDLVLGVDPTTDRGEGGMVLPRGATLLLYTDGLVERRGCRIRTGIAQLEEAVADLAHLPLGELCDELLRRMLPDQPMDDVALVALRTGVR
ncbi:SpoIIE family protein phosphatase, partial [Cellulomonas bogoriensis]|uniref:SpoIIE family protein phosphatase n=1 Tax=Cellulomonas bogoriensis TaxID=301388 RepID=UPI0012EB2AFD